MRRGDVVILDHPFSDGSGSKVRPALVVQNDRDNRRLTNTIVALITRNVSRAAEPSQLVIDVSSPEGQPSGLNQKSAVVCTNLFTVSQTKIRHVISTLPPTLMAKVDVCLRVALDLP
jgi:mRNA interferase MazF